MKKTKVLFLVFLLILVAVFIYYKNLEKDSYQVINKQNTCVSCHVDMRGFSFAHSPNKISCIACHLGNDTSFDKKEAHHKMVVVPGNLSNASQTCAKCHQGIDYRVTNSMMNTMSGIISVDKYVFEEHNNLDSLFSIHHLKNISAADNHLRNKCASCHLGNEKENPHPITERSRGGGCTACHLNYSEKAKKSHHNYITSDKQILPNIHPSLSLKVSNNHCFGCHSRSGRIATNYEGWHETIFKDTLYTNSNYRVLEDKRVFEKQNPDIHHTKGLSCIDCHDSFDVMGNGKKYAHQEDATNVNCEDCHMPFSKQINKLKTVNFNNLNQDEKRIVKLKKIDTTQLFVHSDITNKNLINVVINGSKLNLISKLDAKKLTLSRQGSTCSEQVHNKLNCSACHTSWAPQCIQCHTQFDKDEDGYDLFSKDWGLGKWQEQGEDYLAEFPSLGVAFTDTKKTIKTFSPGMILHLQKSDSTIASFHRLFAPVSAHTISKKGKSCKDCHNNPVVLGYGRGKLTYKNKEWSFKPSYPLESDGIPQDAWIAFLSNDTLNKTTRNNARPFTLKEQKRILKVGTCLTCHKDNSVVVKMILTDYKKALKNKKKICE